MSCCIFSVLFVCALCETTKALLFVSCCCRVAYRDTFPNNNDLDFGGSFSFFSIFLASIYVFLVAVFSPAGASMVAKPMAPGAADSSSSSSSAKLDIWLDEDAQNASAHDLGLTVIDHSFRAMLHSLAQGLAVVVVFMSALVVLLVAAFYLRYACHRCVGGVRSETQFISSHQRQPNHRTAAIIRSQNRNRHFGYIVTAWFFLEEHDKECLTPPPHLPPDVRTSA
jgi:hypothetical protein